MSDLRVFGPKSAEWLAEAGFKSFEEIENVGSIAAYLRVKEMFPQKVTLNMLWGLQAALMGLDWRSLPDEIKQDLLAELRRQERLPG